MPAGADHGRLAEGTIAYVLSGYPVVSQTFVRDEIAALRAAGRAVDVTSMTRADRDRIPLAWSGPVRTAADITRFGALRDGLWWLRRPRAVLRLARALRRTGFARARLALRGVPTVARRLAARDVVVCHSHFGWAGLVAAVYVGALLDRPVTATLHAADIYLAGPELARSVALLDRVITVCEYNVRRLEALGVDPAHVRVVPCGVDTTVPVPPTGDPALVVSVGRLMPKKGMDVLLRAFGPVVEAVPHARLEIVGEGPEEASLRRLVSELGLDGRVTFAGALDHAHTLERIGAGAVFALACRVLPDGDSDAVPVAIREAMVRARPVVTTSVAGIPENVDDETGWVVPSEDPESLAKALVEALEDASARQRKGEAARRRQVDHYSLTASAERLQDLWAGLVEARAGTRR
ncbi:glycosyltransferase family 4 protein [Actinotalea ferrariae]|uniref:glycosyltransferase family 4 protein n=1 Tax=Actinotalea ferrariae TaxID=1386098 RepID=UPI001C8C495C|nr:glycosyltransferase family 4 protein [Actinotalea ferrariae]MBX9244517.1 glycosyltransferase family 4 protein [Actinotalea ferrariae]